MGDKMENEREIKMVQGEMTLDEQVELARAGWWLGKRARINGRTTWTWWRQKQVDSTGQQV